MLDFEQYLVNLVGGFHDDLGKQNYFLHLK
jgi:hypothetical protein